MKTNCIRVKILVTMIKVLLCENWKKKMFSENSQHVFFSHRILTRFESYIGIILIRTFFRSRQRMSFWFISGTQKMLLNRGFCFFLFMSNFFFFCQFHSGETVFFSSLSVSFDWLFWILPSALIWQICSGRHLLSQSVSHFSHLPWQGTSLEIHLPSQSWKRGLSSATHSLLHSLGNPGLLQLPLQGLLVLRHSPSQLYFSFSSASMQEDPHSWG